MWRCQFCNQEQQGISKKLSLWSLPDVLVLHLKRFDQVSNDLKFLEVQSRAMLIYVILKFVQFLFSCFILLKMDKKFEASF